MDLDPEIQNETVRTMILHLKFLSKIKSNEKINVKELFVRDDNLIIQRLFRTIRNWSIFFSNADVVESNDATLTFIKDTITTTLRLIQTYQTSDDYKRRIAMLLTENLEASKSGIRNLIGTYHTDRRFTSEAEAVLQILETRIKFMKENGGGIITAVSDESFIPQPHSTLPTQPSLS